MEPGQRLGHAVAALHVYPVDPAAGTEGEHGVLVRIERM
jgi:hypothetical protein